MSHEVPSDHPSLHPPRHGHPPDDSGGAPPPSWVLLDRHAYVADRENATSAYGVMSNGAAIRVTFCTAPPPLVSYICVWCPDLPPSELVMEPTVETAEADLVHFRVPIRAHSGRCDHFVYKAPGGGKGPSLSRLERPDRYLHYRGSVALLAHREIGDIGTHVEDDGHYYLATLNHDSRRPGNFNLLLHNSMDKTWSSSNVSPDRPHIHVTAKTITLGEGGLMGFVDPWRGILVCDILGRKPEHYLPLPEHLIRLDKLHNEPLLSRDIAFVNGRLTLVEMHRSTSYPDRSLNRLSWEVSTWSISSPWGGQDGWQMDYRINTSSIVVDDGTANADLLSKLQDNGATPQPALDRLHFAHPTLSLSESHTVYLMGKGGMWDKKTLVLSIDMRNPRLQGAATFDAERMMGCTYTQSRISKFFNMVPGKRNVEDAMENAVSANKQKIVHVKDSSRNVKGHPSPKKIESSCSSAGKWSVEYAIENAVSAKKQMTEFEKATHMTVGAKKVKKQPSPRKVESRSASDSKDGKLPPQLKPSSVSVQKKTHESDISSSDSDDDSDEDVHTTAPVAIKAVPILSYDCHSKNKPAKRTTPVKRPLASDVKNEQDFDAASYKDSDGSDVNPLKKKQKYTAPSAAANHATRVATKSISDDGNSEENSDDGNLKQAQHKKPKTVCSSVVDSSEEDVNEESDEAAKTPKNKLKTCTIKQKQSTGSRTVFVSNLSYNVEHGQVRDFFEDADNILDVRFAIDVDGNFKGFAFVEFTSAEAAKKVLRFSGHHLMGRPVKLEIAVERPSYNSNNRRENSFLKKHQRTGDTVFIKGFNTSLGEDQIRSSLEEHFGCCGAITQVSIPVDYRTGANKGIAFVKFRDHGSLSKACELNSSDLDGFRLYVDEARPGPGERDRGFSGGRRGSGGRGRGFGGWGTGRMSTGNKTTFGDDE